MTEDYVSSTEMPIHNYDRICILEAWPGLAQYLQWDMSESQLGLPSVRPDRRIISASWVIDPILPQGYLRVSCLLLAGQSTYDQVAG